ncbi:hypothetical protein CDAR_465411 [Caerostris darwini]|uniref:Uncharacterized protein n=1 Tax=Caerostris darwini TaxID=1538125 RepID=A0AAV4SC34_9ARAC|nr:hypothetical protein CDAR_465411 [Caerostris darwini]
MDERVTPRPPATHIHFPNTTPPSIPKKKKRKKGAEMIGRSLLKKNESFLFRGQNRNMWISQFGDTFQEMSFLVQDGQTDAARQECRQKRHSEMGGLKMSLQKMGKNTAVLVIGREVFISFFISWMGA